MLIDPNWSTPITRSVLKVLKIAFIFCFKCGLSLQTPKFSLSSPVIGN